MKRDSITIKQAIVHFLNSAAQDPVFSDEPLDTGLEICDFLSAHIEKFTESDETKHCKFTEGSGAGELICNCNTSNFVETSRQLCRSLYAIMNENIDIPAADVVAILFSSDGADYFGMLKLNYKTSYTHARHSTNGGSNLNNIVLQRSILPAAGQKLTEAFIVNLSDEEIILAEKKFDINGEKKFYLSEIFLECHAPMSQKEKMDAVSRAVEQVNNKYYGYDDLHHKLETRKAFHEELEEKGCLAVEDIKDIVFEGNLEMQADLEEKLAEYDLANEVIRPKKEATTKKFQFQHLVSDTGVEIIIPMEDYKDPERVAITTQEDGTATITIKNIERLYLK